MSAPEPQAVELVIVESETQRDAVSLRCWCPKKGRLSGSRVREALTEAGYRPGDVIEVRLKRGAVTTREVLVAARALIDTPEKWYQGWYTNHRGCRCALGAVRHAAGIENDLSPATAALRASLVGWSNVGDFNDAPTTTHADVMALFDRAIAACGGEP